MSTKKVINKKYRFLRRMLRVLLGFFFLLLLLVLFIRSSWGQSIIVDKAVNYVSNKTNTKVTVEKLFITFNGALQLDGLYLEDKKGDTLIYSKSLEANVPLWGMISGKSIGVDYLEWDGLRANIIRKDTVAGYNFQFLVDAFATENTTSVVKDTTAKPLDIILGKLNLKNINVDFKDTVLGIDSKFKIGSLTTEMESLDIEKMIFNVSDISLSNSKIKFTQRPITTELPATDTVLPILSAESISIKNTKLLYNSTIDNTLADLDIGEFYTEIPKLDLTNKQFKLNTFQLKGTTILVEMKTANKNKKNIVKKNTSTTLSWPNIALEIEDVSLEDNSINYIVDNSKHIKNKFNANAISLNNVNLKASDIFLKDKKGSIELETFNFKERSGLNLKTFAFIANITDKKLEISDLNIAINKNKIKGFAKVDYKSLSQLIASPEKTNIQLNIPSFNLWLDEIFRFQPSLKQNEYLRKLTAKEFKGTLNIKGTLSNVEISKTKVNWGKATTISLNGSIKNATKTDLLVLNFPSFGLKTNRSDLIKIIDEKELKIKLPEDILISGNINGSLKNIVTDAKINTSQGFATIKGTLKNDAVLNYNLAVNIDKYKVGELLKNSKFGDLSLTLNSEGSGENINNIDATLKANVSKFQLGGYTISGLKLEGDFKDGQGNIISKYKDENLNVDLNAFVKLDSITSEANLKLNVIGADLQALGIVKRNVKTGMEVALDFKGNSNSYNISTDVKNGVVVYDNRTYLVGEINAKAYVDKDTTAVSVKNKMVALNLESNTDPQTFSKALQRHVLSYFYKDEVVLDSIVNPVNLQLEAKIAQTSLIKDVFLVNVKDIDTINVAVDFKENKRILKANITAPHINYSGNELDSLSFSMNTDKDNFNFNLGFRNITAGPINVPKTIITGNQANNELSLNFLGFYKGEKLMNVNTKITGNREKLRFAVSKDSLILNGGKWTIPEDNAVVLSDNNLAFSNFKISKDEQSIEITDQLKNIAKSHIALVYNNFQINEVFNYLNPESEITKGLLNGNFILEEPFTNTGIIADVSIKDFEVLKTNLGKLTIDAKSLGSNKYDFNAQLKEGDVNLDLKGDYFVDNNDANLNLNLIINQFKMHALNTLSLGEVKETSGSFSGDFKVTGTTSEPKYKGSLIFKEAAFNVTKLNTIFTLKNEILNVDNTGFSMENFTVLDAKNNTLVLSGKIKTKSFINPKFDLKLKANNFRILNATKKDNETLFGKVTFNANATLTGDLQIPKLNAKFTLGKDTDVTYVMPSTYASVEERDEVVAFVNRKNPNAILTQTEEKAVIISGFDITSQLKVNKEANVTIIIDESTGDNFKVSGEGDFVFTMIPNGRISLTGVYEISNGHYELTLYNLVNRKFLLAPGGRISWSGDPFDAKLDVSAIYKLETSASPLMASQVSDEDASVKNKYKQVLPFQVYLNIDGELLQPKISFDLDMAEEDQGAIGGQVYGRVQQVKQQETELNKQVFSLLVLNRFYPDTGSDGSLGGFASIARNNLNDAVSGQLNAFSDKILGSSGIKLDFGINSFTDYQGDAPTDRTQLDIAAQKKLFNERLVVRVGSEVDIQGSSTSGEETPLIGNVSLEYKITEDGRYRLKGFRKSEFENVIDGQTIVSGIGLIFTQEFNEFHELWNALLRSQKNKEKEGAKTKETVKDLKKKTN
ncbi:translocation/assembly module TamB domain-containing protein [Polaribacter sp. PL03]|uniref:translocation/assembly module TamB domain-containing protein n=1 Tax=Polaribacter sp. PL03 TaxID=3088353 RepID=UPI0029D02A1A|nr:translocation/assembly module TamB domain-containing protein [Polaribacter sp. PL03]MDX6746381.1 translocation/assembly module TamB domain-containing protein [Polaribacter sp. PL03]